VVAPVAGEEGDPATRHLADRDRRRRRPERGVDDDLLDVVEQHVEAGAPVDADVGAPPAGERIGHDETDVELAVELLSLDGDPPDDDSDGDPPSLGDEEPEPPSPEDADELDDVFDEPVRLSVL
jgi:hypothetical protein